MAQNRVRRPEVIGRSPRPIEALPVSVSDALVLERLGARSEDDLAGPSVQAVRDAKLLAFVLGVHATTLLPTQGGTPLWEVGVHVDAAGLADRVGMEVPRVDAAVQRLVRAGVLSRQTGDTVSFSEAVCGSRTWSDEVPWSDILGRLQGQLSAIVVCRAIARHKERAEHPIFEWTPIPDASLGKLTGFSGSTIRRVRSRLRDAGVIEEQRVEGAPSVFRFPRILPFAAGSTRLAMVAPPPLPSPAPSAPAASAPPAPASGPRRFVVPEGVSIEAFGSPLALPAGFEVEIGDGVGAVRVEKDAEGRDVLRLGPLAIRRV